MNSSVVVIFKVAVSCILQFINLLSTFKKIKRQIHNFYQPFNCFGRLVSFISGEECVELMLTAFRKHRFTSLPHEWMDVVIRRSDVSMVNVLIAAAKELEEVIRAHFFFRPKCYFSVQVV